jgi:adenosylcobinamide kinase/adenosylcobinamide-phosphate guanylyltransferase
MGIGLLIQYPISGSVNMESGRVVLVTGGARSGKSEYTEKLLSGIDDVLYIATSKAEDDEMKKRIEKHRQRRNSRWSTYEGFRDLGKIVDMHAEKSIMLDCVTIMVTNIMFEGSMDFDSVSDSEIQNIIEEIEIQFKNLIDAVRKSNRRLFMVTNEVGYGIVPENKIARVFRDIAGTINQYIASHCDEVYLVACGLPLKLR